MNDLSQTIAPKSDQMNADDLIAGPRTIRISRVSVDVGGEQPVALNFEGDNGKPFRPCKSMRRVLVALWGADGSAYAGRSMTLYRDETVQFGGLAVGGIRISHMSDIDAEKTLVLTATKKSRKPFTVRRLVVEPAAEPREIYKSDLTLTSVPAPQFARFVRRAIASIHDAETLNEWHKRMATKFQSAEEAADAEEQVVERRLAIAEAQP